MSAGPALHDALGPLAGLLGTWSGDGHGHYPTIDDFAYREHVTFGHVGKPFLAYAQRTRDPVTGAPMHAETGYLRPIPHGERVGLELVLAHPFGVVEVEEGDAHVADDGSLVLELATTTIGTTTTAKDVRGLRRRFVLAGDTLTYDVWMTHAATPMTHHLAAVLEREDRGGTDG